MRCKHSTLAVVRRSQKFFCPAADPLPGGAGWPKFNQLEMITTFTYKPSWRGSMHAISSYHGNRSTNTHTTNRQDRLQYTALQLACSVKITFLAEVITEYEKLVPWGTDGRLPLSDLDLDLGSGHTAYRRASLIDLYLRTKFHRDQKNNFF